jgi:hypothetical protein
MLHVTIEGISEIERKWQSTVRVINDGATNAVIAAAKAGVQEAKRSATWTDRTGDARRTITTKMGTRAFGTTHVDMVAPLHYHRYLDAGTKPHEILPVRARFLRFEARDGSIVFARRVWHPGTKGDGFAGKMYLKAERVLRAEMEAVMARAAAMWG